MVPKKMILAAILDRHLYWAMRGGIPFLVNNVYSAYSVLGYFIKSSNIMHIIFVYWVHKVSLRILFEIYNAFSR